MEQKNWTNDVLGQVTLFKKYEDGKRNYPLMEGCLKT